MPWESVPWAVTNGQASAEIARVGLYASTQGAEGIIGADDLRVTQLGVPGASVNIGVGAALIPNRAANQQYQSYAGRMPTQDTVGVASSGASARNDLIIARVEDPWLTGEPWADPAPGQEATGPYIFTRVLSGLTAAQVATFESARAHLISLGMSAIPLAAIILPANTASVLTAHIRDLRRVAAPRRERRVYTVNPGAAVAVPAAMGNWIGSWQVSVPPWATRAVVTLQVGGMRHTRSSTTVAGTAAGQVRAMLGTLPTQAANYDFETSINNIIGRNAVLAGDTVTIPTGTRGTTVTATLQASFTAGNVAPSADTGTFAVLDIEFQEVAG